MLQSAPGDDGGPVPPEDAAPEDAVPGVDVDRFRDFDADFVRVLEDVIELLIERHVIQVTDLPPAARDKLMRRAQLRDRIRSLQTPLQDDDLL